ncbi:hypothetical protein [Winogradskyella sp. UBA3174]|uniref:hypothetical protein n=1 Tax=Winogradskyella sp. UBA3174 TaxID=1947785 RepID=UPI0025EA0F65|nr:hypothetical protein [Winogradskyella sp. UBA3174]
MKKFLIKDKIFALVLVIAFTFQSMGSINSHTYTTGISSFHENCPTGITCCFGHSYHTIYQCGTPSHFEL